ncbi:leucyl/phenylalanyl-tRNA--protein transferase (plasmid) [Pedobacter sp. BS3]|uniref:leucyl/phenylalanyl-tRNA--protein transferase n=1 Tax=Pedobacter sp. BS3 TaxID=2567937 RepID=UPI0011EFB448|nr:leucyl/phenylalanyl-tRNA--protein transferase [Pedobacter sp. BS3]TZF85861.1 leucyl/phenylalanyl-tRNA--protein transferase [Pedobacter sp. BS3]
MIFLLDKDSDLPDPALAEDDGLLAVGGDLSTERLLSAYRKGIFPWYADNTPILWYAPHQRFVLFPDKVKVSKSMKKVMRSNIFRITFNQAFADVIRQCAAVSRQGQDGTWITADMQQAYITLHEKGYAHSVEVWQNTDLVGGLYGVEINTVFCGESMFSKQSNASKAALVWLCKNRHYTLIDCQVYTGHLERMGAQYIPASAYMGFLNEGDN